MWSMRPNSMARQCIRPPRSAGGSGRHERVRRIELRLVVDADLLENGHQLFAEPPARLLRLPYVDDTEALWALTGGMHEQALDRPVRRRLHPMLAAQLAHDLVVPLLGYARTL